jgi:histidyl-tRNA synthetase
MKPRRWVGKGNSCNWGVEVVSTEVERFGEFKQEVIDVLRGFLDQVGVDYRFVGSVKRGLTYYVEEGFEVECDNLGAQKQIAGGGSYKEGVGFAIGLERLLLAKK